MNRSGVRFPARAPLLRMPRARFVLTSGVLTLALVLASWGSARPGVFAQFPSPDASYAAVAGTGCGTIGKSVAFAVEPDILVTTAHSVAGRHLLKVSTNSHRRLNAFIVGFDAESDIAALRVPGLNAKPVHLEAKDNPQAAERGSRGTILTVLPDGKSLEKPYVLLRRVRAIVDDLYFASRSEVRALHLGFAVSQGDSGSAVLTETGEVIGMVFLSSVDHLATGYAVRSVEIADVLRNSGRRPLSTNCPRA